MTALKILNFLCSLESELKKPGMQLHFWRVYLKKIKCKQVPQKLWIGPRTVILNFGEMQMSESFAIGSNCLIVNWGTIAFGKEFLGSNNISINTGGHNPEDLKPFRTKIIIGSRVFAGTNSIFTGNVKIGSDAVIGAGAVVTKDIPSGAIVVGNPCRIIRRQKRNNINSVWKWWHHT